MHIYIYVSIYINVCIYIYAYLKKHTVVYVHIYIKAHSMAVGASMQLGKLPFRGLRGSGLM